MINPEKITDLYIDNYHMQKNGYFDKEEKEDYDYDNYEDLRLEETIEVKDET